MAADDARLLEIKERAAAVFLAMPGVTGVGIGGRLRDGRPTGEVVIKVFVERKRPAAEVPPGLLLPPEFEGVGVDVSELAAARLEAEPPAPPGPRGVVTAASPARRGRRVAGRRGRPRTMDAGAGPGLSWKSAGDEAGRNTGHESSTSPSARTG